MKIAEVIAQVKQLATSSTISSTHEEVADCSDIERATLDFLAVAAAKPSNLYFAQLVLASIAANPPDSYASSSDRRRL